jgi:hypothetical protein
MARGRQLDDALALARCRSFAKSVIPGRAGARATIVSQPMRRTSPPARPGQNGLRRARYPEGFPLFSRAHAFPGARRRSRVVSLRLVLALWAAAIYAIYWLGYLRGPL